MSKPLIIVESPTKVRTLKKFLGAKYNIESSVGHIRDLPQKGFGIDIEHDFEPQYINLPEKKDVIQKLKSAAKNSEIVYLATDPDREGEAIAWHILQILPPGTKSKRMTFHEITKEAVTEALKNPRNIDIDLVNAQQARRLLDRIVGYKISPILMRRVQGARDGGLSAGRVQSVALKLVVDREKEIEAFIPVEYWNISVLLDTLKEKKTFEAHLYSVDGKRIDKMENPEKNIISINNELSAKTVCDRLKKATYRIDKIEKKEKKRNPVPPFITSSLQQEASRHYGFSAQRTMGIAQSLYEGIDMGKEGTEGLITYMRTDSVRVAPEAIRAVRSHIQKKYGKEYLPESERVYTTKKTSQDAHEAIRPTNLNHPPEFVKPYLSIEQYKLYLLVWRRFVASQMNPAIYDTVSCDIATNQQIMLRSTGSVIKFPGFLAVYQEKHDLEEEEEKEKLLPFLEEKDQLKLNKVNSEQAFTKPPPRFTEASLVKELERLGIGRPSTYAAIMNKIQSRDYTTKEKGTLKPTELGKVIAQLLETNFQLIMNIGFTAAMEDALEEISEKKKDWKKLISDFWSEFIPIVEVAEKEAFVPKVETDYICPKCGNKLVKIWAKGRYFYGCSTYPDCDYTITAEALNFNKADYDPNFDWDQPCPICKGKMQLRHGKFGPFLGCTNYPTCRGIVNIPKVGEPVPENLPACPAIGCDGKLTQRRSRFGKIFFSCSNFPDCDVIVNDLDDLQNKYPNHPKTPYVKKERKKKGKGEAKGRTQPLKTPSAELAAIVGKEEMTRGDVIKKLWEYIKKNDLQDSKNKRLIVPDAKLRKVFGTDKPVDMMKLAGLIGKHLS
jgi:DNA topoisomerase I